MTSPQRFARRARAVCFAMFAVSITSMLVVAPANAKSNYCDNGEKYALRFDGESPAFNVAEERDQSDPFREGLLRARTLTPDLPIQATKSWEQWAFVCGPDQYIALKGPSGKYASVQTLNGFTNVLRTTVIPTVRKLGPRELFLMEFWQGNRYLKNKETGLYVSAERGYNGNLKGMLRARASVRGPWEAFSLQDYY
jgi:hypothetical protein